MSTYFTRSACPYDCPDTCGLLVETDGRTVFRVKGDPEHPVTKGFLCRKMQRYDLSINHPERILYPLQRVGRKGSGDFRRIGWEAALETIAGKWRRIIADHGPEAILPYSYSGPMSLVGRHGGMAFFNYLGASNLVRTICCSGKNAAWASLMGAMGDLDPREMAASDLIIIWGSDVTATRLHLVPQLQASRRQGAKILLIETCAGPTAELCDETILVRPGSDGALALAMMRVLLEEGLADKAFLAAHTRGWEKLEPELGAHRPEAVSEATGVPAATIRRLARMYAGAKAPAILLGSGASRHRNGAMNCRCVALLPAVVGAWGKPGGGIAGFGPLNPFPCDVTRITRPDLRKKPVRSINMNQLAAALDEASLQPPIKSLYVYGSNPAAVAGNQKKLLEHLGREDLFTVVHERFMTDTARFADIVLPSTFSVEQADIYPCYGYCTLQAAPAVVPPPAECKSPWDAFRALAAALGFDEPHFQKSEQDLVDEILSNSPQLRETLAEQEYADLLAGRGISFPFAEHLRFATADGKIAVDDPELPSLLPGPPSPPDKGYPLRMVAAPSPYTLNSTFNERDDLTAKRGPLSLIIHSEDARARGIIDGGRVICFNELARVEYTAKVTDTVLPGTVVGHGVYRLDKTHNGLSTNALLRERLSDLGEATTLNDNGVEVEAGT